MNFQEAINELKKGKKVRRKIWHKDVYCFNEKGVLCMVVDNTKTYGINFEQFEAQDWEIYEEKLSDKEQIVEDLIKNFPRASVFHYDDVKEALKEFIDYVILVSQRNSTEIKQKAKEIFGDELFV